MLVASANVVSPVTLRVLLIVAAPLAVSIPSRTVPLLTKRLLVVAVPVIARVVPVALVKVEFCRMSTLSSGLMNILDVPDTSAPIAL